MTTFSFADLYSTAESGAANGIPTGLYEVTVDDVRIKAESRMLFLDLKVLNGPSAGTTAQVNLRIPGEGDKQGAFFHFNRKINGFQGPDLKTAFTNADNAPTPEAALSVIADALRGKSVSADIKLVTEGQYKGTNELTACSPLAGAPAAAPAPAPQAAVPQPQTSDGTTAPSETASVPF